MRSVDQRSENLNVCMKVRHDWMIELLEHCSRNGEYDNHDSLGTEQVIADAFGSVGDRMK